MDNLTAHNSSEYDKGILNTIPYYESFHKETLSLIKHYKSDCKVWLDTGAGTGSLINTAYNEFPDTKFILADISEGMLDKAKERLSYINEDKIEFLYNCSSQELNNRLKTKVDVITAIQVHHYLSKEERAIATKSIYESLNDGGIYVTFENMRPLTELGIKLGLDRWRDFQINAGKSVSEADKHVARFDKNHFPITILDHLELLKEAGFKYYEVFWVSTMQCGLYAVK